jgi:cysteine desulfurase
VFVSAVEHSSVSYGRKDIIPIPVSADGVTDIVWLEKKLAECAGEKVLVSVMAANNENGALQPLDDVLRIVRRHGAFLHTDCVQALGKIPVSFAGWGVDYMSLSAHKIGGPKGAGALIVRSGAPFEALLSGGGQEKYRRGGTENAPAIAGFGAAASHIADILAAFEQVRAVRDYMEDQLTRRISDAVIFARKVSRLPNTSHLAVPGTDRVHLMMALDLAGISVSSGAACSAGKVVKSHVLEAMGVSDDLAAGALRISFGWGHTRSDADRFLDVFTEIVHKQKKS